jgi:hypothetical protein
MNTRGRHTLFKNTLDVMWYIRTFIASSLNAQNHFRELVTDLFTYLERTLKKNKELTWIKGLMFKLLQEKEGSNNAIKAKDEGQQCNSLTSCAK